MEESRILIVDDNEAIHRDFHAVLATSESFGDQETQALEDALFNDELNCASEVSSELSYQIDDAMQGEQAVEMVHAAAEAGDQYSLIFMDVRMPPGIDGIETINRIWKHHRNIEMVLCTAYSDYSWDEIVKKFGVNDQLLFLRKPFDATAVKQVTLSLTTKYRLRQEAKHYIENLESEVGQRTIELTRAIASLMATNQEQKRTIARLSREAELSK